MQGLFTREQAQEILKDYQYLLGAENYLSPYPILKVGFIRAIQFDDGKYDIFVGVESSQLDFPEFMGYSTHSKPLLIFLKLKGIPFDCDKYKF